MAYCTAVLIDIINNLHIALCIIDVTVLPEISRFGRLKSAGLASVDLLSYCGAAAASESSTTSLSILCGYHLIIIDEERSPCYFRFLFVVSLMMVRFCPVLQAASSIQLQIVICTL